MGPIGLPAFCSSVYYSSVQFEADGQKTDWPCPKGANAVSRDVQFLFCFAYAGSFGLL